MPGIVRRATKADAPQIVEIIADLVREPSQGGFQREWTTAEVEQWMERQGDDGAFFVVEDRHILAFGTVDFSSDEPDAASFGAYVRAQNRRQGHGAALAEECMAFARQRGYKRIKGRLPANNEPALSYLSSVGALVPLTNPGSSFELPIYQDSERGNA
jgi:ribosomal protein S18 acetylase RimI-like enzyme